MNDELSSWSMTKRLMPFVLRERQALAVCSSGALVSGALAQTDPLVLAYVVDHVTSATTPGSTSAIAIMVTAGVILLCKQIATAIVQFLQSYSGERIKTSVAGRPGGDGTGAVRRADRPTARRHQRYMEGRLPCGRQARCVGSVG